MSYLLATDIKTRFFVEIKNSDKNSSREGSFDALAKNLDETTVELVTYKFFPVGTKLNIDRMQEKLLGTVTSARFDSQDIAILKVKILYVED
ncbi:MAG: hypothetical protein HY819_22530 [Acidobacteria bacterium]|nr:hypothetical protein [Acidobacteriota bacterium]